MYLRGNPIAFAFCVSGVLHGAFRYGLCGRCRVS